jgi:hypothetical protein
MKQTTGWLFLSLALFISACSENEELIQPPEEPQFYMNLTLGDTTFSITSDNYVYTVGGYSLLWMMPLDSSHRVPKSYVRGNRSIHFEPLSSGEVIEKIILSVSIVANPKSLDPADEFSYSDRLVNASEFVFPFGIEAFYSTYNENENKLIPNVTVATAYLHLSTKDHIYTSSSVAATERAEEAFFKVDNIAKVNNDVEADYHYIIEGSFTVDMYEELNGPVVRPERVVKIVTATFRWPLRMVPTSRLLELGS